MAHEPQFPEPGHVNSAHKGSPIVGDAVGKSVGGTVWVVGDAVGDAVGFGTQKDGNEPGSSQMASAVNTADKKAFGSAASALHAASPHSASSVFRQNDSSKSPRSYVHVQQHTSPSDGVGAAVGDGVGKSVGGTVWVVGDGVGKSVGGTVWVVGDAVGAAVVGEAVGARVVGMGVGGGVGGGTHLFLTGDGVSHMHRQQSASLKQGMLPAPEPPHEPGSVIVSPRHTLISHSSQSPSPGQVICSHDSGAGEIVGATVGKSVGGTVWVVGDGVGAAVVGEAVGWPVGDAVGALVGFGAHTAGIFVWQNESAVNTTPTIGIN